MIRRGGRAGTSALLAVAGALLAAAPSLGQDRSGPDGTGGITGRVTRAGGPALPYAWVRIRGSGGSLQTLADSLGWYRMDAPAGALLLEAEYLGHRTASVEVVVPAGETVRVDVALEEQALDLPGFVVVADPFAVAPPEPRELRPIRALDPTIELATLAMDGGLAGVAGAVTDARPGGDTPPPDGGRVLLMRGSTADLKLLLLDGAPVYTPFHLGGVLETFDVDVLGRAAHFVGAAPSRYDGGLDYVLDLDTRRPTDDGVRFRGALDLLSARVSAEWGEPRGGVLASGRAIHDLGARMLDGVENPYGYRDALLRGAWTVGGLEVGGTAFANREAVALGLPDAPLVPDQAAWSNRALSLRARHRVGPLQVAWTAAGSRYDAALPLRTDTALTASTNPVLAEGRTRRLRADLDVLWPRGPDQIRFGFTADDLLATYGSSLRTPDGYARTDTRTDGTTFGVHGEWLHALTPRLNGRLGARLDRFDPGGTRGALRASLGWSVSPSAVLTVAAGRYHQFTRTTDGVVEEALVAGLRPADEFAQIPDGLLSVATGDHVLVGLDQSLTPAVRLGLQGYVKRFVGIGGPELSRTSSGVDLRLQATGGAHVGWLGYALAWEWEDERAIASRFAGRHVMSAGWQGPVAGPVGIDARVSFSDGLPFTQVPLDATDAEFGSSDDREGPTDLGSADAPALAGRAGDFLRVDVEIFGEWSAPFGQGRIRPYLRVLNALDRRDALFYYFEPWRSPEVRPLVQRPLLPVVGLAWSF